MQASERAREGSDPGTVSRLALVIGAVTLFHLLALPLGVSCDGQLHIDHARALFTSRFWNDWDLLRYVGLHALLLFSVERMAVPAAVPRGQSRCRPAALARGLGWRA